MSNKINLVKEKLINDYIKKIDMAIDNYNLSIEPDEEIVNLLIEIVNVFENETSYTVMIYNNGRSPEKAIREGGGLTNLRYRIETAGGMMLVQSFPEFALVIEIPGLERREREE